MDVVEDGRGSAAESGQQLGMLARGDGVGRRHRLTLLASLPQDTGNMFGEQIGGAAGAGQIPEGLVKLRSAIAGSITGQFGDAKERIGHDGGVDCSPGRFRRRLRIVAVQEQVEAAANDHRLVRLPFAGAAYRGWCAA